MRSRAALGGDRVAGHLDLLSLVAEEHVLVGGEAHSPLDLAGLEHPELGVVDHVPDLVVGESELELGGLSGGGEEGLVARGGERAHGLGNGRGHARHGAARVLLPNHEGVVVPVRGDGVDRVIGGLRDAVVAQRDDQGIGLDGRARRHRPRGRCRIGSPCPADGHEQPGLVAGRLGAQRLVGASRDLPVATSTGTRREAWLPPRRAPAVVR